MSVEYYVAFYAGVLSAVEEFKNIADLAKAEVEKARQKKENEQ